MKLIPFYFTFHDTYRTVEHPNKRSGITPTPDGYVTILAYTEGGARDLANKAIAPWLFQKTEKPQGFYPLGNLTTIT